jgi:hypothetical protein
MFDGRLYPTVEHAYVAAKTIIGVERDEVFNCESAGQAKRLGKTITLRSDWDEIKYSVMVNLLNQKFKQPTFKALLQSSSDQYIVEGNLWGDTYWGAVLDDDGVYIGKNNLGKIIMSIRAGYILESFLV